MTIQKIEESFSDITGIRLASNSYLNLFNILKNDDSDYFLNLFKSYTAESDILENEDFFEVYQTEENDWWENISNKYYGTPNLWWLITLSNKINNPFEEIHPGKNIKVLKKPYLYIVFKDMQNIAEL